jgi:enterochelin esterase-like enzyme
MIPRRAVLGGLLASLVARRASADKPSLAPEYSEEDLQNLRLRDISEDGRRFVLVTPRWQNEGLPLPLAVFLHGLGETTNERLGAYAWVEKYGLASAWQRLKRAPIAKTSSRGEWTDARLAEVNAELEKRPFRGFAMACPFMPNPHGPADLDDYANWIERSLLPRVRKGSGVPVTSDPARTYLAGVSLGGYVSLEVLARRPRLFGAWAGLQTAIGTWAAAGYADKIAKAGPVAGTTARPLLVVTSSQDHWRASSEALAAAFDAKSLPHTFRSIPGPHDQPWLREAGTLELLHWLDRLAP